jgi:hypothetical protein
MFLAALGADTLDFHFIKVDALIDVIFAVCGQLHFFNFRSPHVVFGFKQWHLKYLQSELFCQNKEALRTA